MTQQRRGGIIGAGRIGWQYDGGRWDGRTSVSHAACMDRHPGVNLVAMLEPDPEIGSRAMKALGNSVLVTSDPNAFFAMGLDLVCIASPTEAHVSHIRQCVAEGVRYLLIEKPVTGNLAAFASLLDYWDGLPSPPRACVNYFRRCLPQVHVVRDACRRSLPRAIDFNYSRKLSVNGVHLLDLLGYICEQRVAPELKWIAKDIDNPSFGLQFGETSITFRGMDLPYHCIEARVTFDDGRLSLLEGGGRLEWEAKEENPDYPGFFRLAFPSLAFDGNLARQSMRDGTYLSLCNLMNENEPVASTFESAAFAEGLLSTVEAECSRT